MPSQTITDYIALVRALIRDNAGGAATPDTTLYAFKDSEIAVYLAVAVDEYTTYRKRRLPYALSLQPGVAQYTLPTDWIEADAESFDEAIEGVDNMDLTRFVGFVLPTLNGTVPLDEMAYNFYDSEQYVIVTPPPAVQATINFDYFAEHVLNNVKSTIRSTDKTYVASLAGAKALRALATDKSEKFQKYKIGNSLTIDDTAIGKYLIELADKLCGAFDMGVVNRPYGEAG